MSSDLNAIQRTTQASDYTQPTTGIFGDAELPQAPTASQNLPAQLAELSRKLEYLQGQINHLPAVQNYTLQDLKDKVSTTNPEELEKRIAQTQKNLAEDQATSVGLRRNLDRLQEGIYHLTPRSYETLKAKIASLIETQKDSPFYAQMKAVCESIFYIHELMEQMKTSSYLYMPVVMGKMTLNSKKFSNAAQSYAEAVQKNFEAKKQTCSLDSKKQDYSANSPSFIAYEQAKEELVAQIVFGSLIEEVSRAKLEAMIYQHSDAQKVLPGIPDPQTPPQTELERNLAGARQMYEITPNQTDISHWIQHYKDELGYFEGKIASSEATLQDCTTQLQIYRDSQKLQQTVDPSLSNQLQNTTYAVRRGSILGIQLSSKNSEEVRLRTECKETERQYLALRKIVKGY